MLKANSAGDPGGGTMLYTGNLNVRLARDIRPAFIFTDHGFAGTFGFAGTCVEQFTGTLRHRLGIADHYPAAGSKVRSLTSLPAGKLR